MTCNGRCQHELALVRENFHTFAAHEFLRRMTRPGLGLDHANCGVDQCTQLQLDMDTYEPKHTSAECDCESLGPPLDEVMQCLDARVIPVPRVCGTRLENAKLDVLSYDEDGGSTPYVALSHLWADGLGNPREIALPRCQILRLASLVRGLDGHRPRGQDHSEDRELFLWCDSLLCPVQPREHATKDQQRGKRYALALIRDVYTRAAYVLVVDASVVCYSVQKIGMRDAATRVFTSRWIHRL